MTQDDRDQLAAIGRGDRRALERVYLACKDDLLTLCVWQTGDRAAAEDVLHDMFVTLAQKARRIELTGSLKNYLCACCINRARDVQRKRRPTQTTTQAIDANAAPDAAPPQIAAAAEESRRAWAAVAVLPQKLREVVTMRVHGRMPFDEIAVALNVPRNTAMSRYRYALDSLRSTLSEERIVP